EQKLAALSRFVQGFNRSLRQLAIIVEGRQILLRQEEGLVEPSGQMRFDFDALDDEVILAESHRIPARTISFSDSLAQHKPQITPNDLLHAAAECEDAG